MQSALRYLIAPRLAAELAAFRKTLPHHRGSALLRFKNRANPFGQGLLDLRGVAAADREKKDTFRLPQITRPAEPVHKGGNRVLERHIAEVDIGEVFPVLRADGGDVKHPAAAVGGNFKAGINIQIDNAGDRACLKIPPAAAEEKQKRRGAGGQTQRRRTAGRMLAGHLIVRIHQRDGYPREFLKGGAGELVNCTIQGFLQRFSHKDTSDPVKNVFSFFSAR